MRYALVLVFALACKDKPVAEAPKPGSASAIALDGPQAIGIPKVSGTPPVKGKPLDGAKAKQLSERDIDGWTRTVRVADDKGLELHYTTKTRPTFVVSVSIARCFDCLAMQLDKWLAKSDALRSLLATELRDHPDTLWELGMTDVAGVPAVWTYHVGYVPDIHATGYALYFNDGLNMIRVVAEYRDDAQNRGEMVRAASRRDLEQIAKSFLDVFVHSWG